NWSQGALAIEAEAAEKIARDLLAEARIEPLEMIDRRGRRIELFELVLGEIADSQVPRGDALAGQWRRHAGQQLDQRGLAGAVRAEQGNAVAGRKTQLHSVEDVTLAIAGCNFVESQQRH